MMSHISKGDIHAYLDGALDAYPEEVARPMREHLDACPECARLLEVERRLKDEASAIIAASAEGPVDLDPLEELLARAAASGGQAGAKEPPQSPATGGARHPVGSRMYLLRWAATIVVSLGAGWMARDVVGPAAVVRQEAVTEPSASDEELRSAADQQRPERDDIAGPAEAETPRESRAPVTRELSEAVAPPESPPAEAGAGSGGDADRAAGRGGDDALLGRVEDLAARRRAEPVVNPDAGSAGVGLRAPEVDLPAQAPSSLDELRTSALDADRRNAAATFGDAASAPSVTASLSTTPFLVPGLPVLDVRLATGADGFAGGTGGSLVVTQELGDGRIVELEFVPIAGIDSVAGGVIEERNGLLNRGQRSGWAMAVREVPGGLAVLSGPLGEAELAELLDRALGQL